MRSLLKIALGIAALVVAFGAGWLVTITGTGQAIPLESLSELERGFAERMQNVVLTGHYTLKGRERRDDKPERYEITRVAKVGEHRWRFDVHMTYGSVDMTLPVVVPIRWVLQDRDRARKMAECGLRRAREMTWERSARELVAVYEQVLSGRRPAEATLQQVEEER